MASSGIVDSGKISGGRSSFSQTCSLLSQYLKEKGSFGDLSLGLTQNSETRGAPTGTMNLLPMIENSGFKSPNELLQPLAGRVEALKISDASGTKSESETAQMTIFYAGRVLVFDNFPSDKAKELMNLAGKSSATQNQSTTTFPPPHAAPSPAESTTNIIPAFGLPDAGHHSAQPPLVSVADLPIARKNSLARFLEKRKDRIAANAPYQLNKPAAAAAKAVKAEGWLGLAAPPFPPQIQRH